MIIHCKYNNNKIMCLIYTHIICTIINSFLFHAKFDQYLNTKHSHTQSSKTSPACVISPGTISVLSQPSCRNWLRVVWIGPSAPSCGRPCRREIICGLNVFLGWIHCVARQKRGTKQKHVSIIDQLRCVQQTRARKRGVRAQTGLVQKAKRVRCRYWRMELSKRPLNVK